MLEVEGWQEEASLLDNRPLAFDPSPSGPVLGCEDGGWQEEREEGREDSRWGESRWEESRWEGSRWEEGGKVEGKGRRGGRGGGWRTHPGSPRRWRGAWRRCRPCATPPRTPPGRPGGSQWCSLSSSSGTWGAEDHLMGVGGLAILTDQGDIW